MLFLDLSFVLGTVFDKFHLPFNFKSKVSRDVFRNKNDVYIFFLKCHLNVICLVVRVISICKVSIDVWFFFFTSQTTCQSINYACQIDVHFIFVSFCVSNIKNLQRLCQKYTLIGDHRKLNSFFPSGQSQNLFPSLCSCR